MKKPIVTVVMPVYNTEKYLSDAINSILQQTYRDFEFIIINDGSTDGSTKIIDDFATIDSRIIVIKQPNHGLVYSLNKAIKSAKGTLIARMDADDVSDKDRLALQLNEFKNDPNLVLVGTGFLNIGPDGTKLSSSKYSSSMSYSDTNIKRELYIRCPFAHGSVMFNKNAAVQAGLYRASVGPTEDYDLWIRLRRMGHYKNLRQKLFKYRIIETSVSSTQSDSQLSYTTKLIEELWRLEPPKKVGSWRLFKEYRELSNIERDNFIHTQKRIMEYAKKYNYKKLYSDQKRFFTLLAGSHKAGSIRRKMARK